MSSAVSENLPTSSMSSSESYPNEMPLDVFFEKTSYVGFTKERIAIYFEDLQEVGCQTVGDLRGPIQWRNCIRSDLYDQITSKLGIESEINDEIYSQLSEKWKSEVSHKISSIMVDKDHPFNFEDEAQILKRQKQFYVGLRKNTMPFGENDVTKCNMLFGSRFIREEKDKEPVFARISSEMKTKVLIETVQSLNDILSKTASVGDPFYVVIQQRGAGKSFEIYHTARDKFVLFFNMSTATESLDMNTKLLEDNSDTLGSASGVNNGVRSYYAEVRKIVNDFRGTTRYNKTLDTTTKLMYASIFHFLSWKKVYPNKPPIDWFRYSFSAQSILSSIFQDILLYNVSSLTNLIDKISNNSDNFDLSKLILAFDEAGELTTDRPVERVFFPRIGRKSSLTDQTHSLFHPFVDALIRMSSHKINRVISGTTLALTQFDTYQIESKRFSSGTKSWASHVSLGVSSALKPDDITILMISSLFRTSDEEIKSTIHYYFPKLKFPPDNRRKWIGRSRFLYDITL